jgi:hypothetical protein
VNPWLRHEQGKWHMTSQNHPDNSARNDDPAKNERLSAWLDGELPLEERAQLEREINESPELQRELDELRQVSDLVQGLPKQAAPDELKPAIMRAVERDTLLVSQTPADADKQRLSALPKVAAVAALVGIAVFMWVNRDQQQRQVADKDIAPVTDHQAPPKMHANRQEERDEVAGQTVNPKKTDTVKAKEFLLEKDQLNAASIGDFVKALVRNGDSVSVVRLRVVDRQESIEALELVLAKEKGVKNVMENNGLVAVYIESGPEKLSEAIAQMGEGLDRMELTQVLLAELDPDFVKAMEAHQKKSDSVISQIPFEAGSKLDQLAKGTESLLNQPTSANATTGDRIRVIFLLGSKSEPARKPATESSSI